MEKEKKEVGKKKRKKQEKRLKEGRKEEEGRESNWEESEILAKLYKWPNQNHEIFTIDIDYIITEWHVEALNI